MMPHSSASGSSMTSEALDKTQQEPIALAPRIVHRFFEPIVLLKALVDAARSTAKSPPREPPIDIQDAKQLFFAFANKLSHVCDREKGGHTVTSFVILKDENNPEQAHYVFAVNRQSESQLQSTTGYVKKLLQKINEAPENPEDQIAVRHSLLYHVLRFNRLRVMAYLRDLRSFAAECLDKCKSGMTEEDRSIAQVLTSIVTTPSAGSNPKDLEVDYIHKCQATIQLLMRIEESKVGKVIEHRARQDRMPGQRSVECWSDLFHTTRRILAYPQSVQFFLLAKKKWPNLFQNPAVSFISSSRPIEKPCRKKSLTAASIVGRMTRKAPEIELFREFVGKLQAFDLDARIREEYGKESFKPIVHAEVLLLNWISNQGAVLPSRFFNDWMYIGGSKAMCKLCDYYFMEHGAHVQHRSSHGNLYTSWRVPDVFPHQGELAIKQRQVMVDKILRRVRNDAFDIVKMKAKPTFKADDSNTYSARVPLDEIRSLHGTNTNADLDDLASMMGEVDIS